MKICRTVQGCQEDFKLPGEYKSLENQTARDFFSVLVLFNFSSVFL